jgi:hypothetical protein
LNKVTWRAARVRSVICPGAAHSRPVAADRLRCIPGDVQEDLDQLFPIADQFRQAGIVVATNAQDGRKLGGQQAAHAFQDLMDVHRPRLHRAVRRQQAPHQILQAVGLLDDHLCVLAQTRIVEFALQQLRRTADAAERVLDFVHQVAYQLAIGMLLLDQALFPGRSQLLIDWPQFDQQAGFRGIDRVDRAVQLQDLATDQPQPIFCPV